MTTVDDALAEIDRNPRIISFAGKKGPRCQTGANYVTLTSGGIKKEGMPALKTFRTEREAIEAWLQAFYDLLGLRLTEEAKRAVYWREEPRLTVQKHPDGGQFYARSRLAVEKIDRQQTWPRAATLNP